MTGFSSLFPDYRRLRTALSETERQRDLLEAVIGQLRDEIGKHHAEKVDLLAKLQHASEEHIADLRKTADSAARMHGRPIFDLASEIPVPPANWEPLPKARHQAYDLVASLEREFEESLRPRPAQNATETTQ